MSRLGLIAISLSALIHALACYLMLPLLQQSDADALDLGHGTAIALVEQGIATEGHVRLGDAMQTIETAEAVPVPPASQPLKPAELRDLISSDANSVEEVAVDDTRDPSVPPMPNAEPIEKQKSQQVAIHTEQSSSQAMVARDAKVLGLYLGQVNRRVERAKLSALSRRSGKVVLRYTIGLDGKLLSREVASSSGFKILDNAAIAALDRAAPFPPIPPEASLKPMTLTQQFEFEARLVQKR